MSDEHRLAFCAVQYNAGAVVSLGIGSGKKKSAADTMYVLTRHRHMPRNLLDRVFIFVCSLSCSI
jgi:hypothetical protein